MSQGNVRFRPMGLQGVQREGRAGNRLNTKLANRGPSEAKGRLNQTTAHAVRVQVS